MISVLLDTSDSEEKMSNVDHLVQLQTDIAADHLIEKVEHETFPYVPLKHGYLQDSFQSKILSPTPHFQADLWYSALSNKGFDYAEKQHEFEFDHPLKGIDHYMTKGTAAVFEEDILAAHIRKVL